MQYTGSKFRMRHQRLLMIVVLVALVALAATAGFFIWQYMQLRNNPTVVAQETNQRLTTEVAKLYNVPTDEQPTIAQISDKSKLGSQAFFQNAQNGDYLLIYTKAKLALLYREKANKLINVGPVNIDSNSAGGTGSTGTNSTSNTNSSSTSNSNSTKTK